MAHHKREIRWVGPRVESNIPHFNNKVKYDFYRSFVIDKISYDIEDFAIVKTNAEDDGQVAQIICVYESHESCSHENSEYRGVVRWYAWARNLKSKFDDENKQFDYYNEVVEDPSRRDVFISLQYIRKKVRVVFASTEDAICLIKNMKLNPKLYFSCRYRIIRAGLKPIFSNCSDLDKTVEDFELKLNSPNYKNSSLAKYCDVGCSQYNTDKNLDSRIFIKKLDHPNAQSEFDSDSSSSSVLSYSIVDDNSASEKSIKIKLKISENNTKSKRDEKEMQITYGNLRRSARCSTRKSYAELLSPEKYFASDREGYISPGDDDNDNLSIGNLAKNCQRLTLNVEARSYTTRLRNKQKKIVDQKCTETINISDDDVSFKNLITGDGQKSTRTRSVRVIRTPNLYSNSELLTPTKKLKMNYNNMEISPTRPREIDLQITPKKVCLFKLDCEGNSPRKSKVSTPKSSRASIHNDNIKNTPSSRMKLIKEGIITPMVQKRDKMVRQSNTPLATVQNRLHVSYVPEALPCREKEYLDIYNFIEGKLYDGIGGCMYVSGVPGTGKTATVTSVIRKLKKFAENGKVPEFIYVEINGMKLTEPRQSYVEILKQLGGKTLPWEQAYNSLELRFAKNKKGSVPVVLLVDELDILCTKRQDVVYNLLDWPTKVSGKLIVITIANTMDLPERLLMNRVTSRLGLTRLTFQAYTHKQLQEIVTKRLFDTESFNTDAVQLVARKVASVSGDARRALDICRKAAEIAETENAKSTVTITHVNNALTAMITEPKIQAIKHCSQLEQIILQSIVAEVERTGVEETTFADVYKMFISVATLNGFEKVSITVASSAVARLNSSRLILVDQKCNDINQKILLNVSSDDVYYALKKD